MTIITIIFSAVTGYMFIASNIGASSLQLLKTKQFLELVDSANGRLLPKYYPNPAADVTPEYFRQMFLTADAQKAVSSVLEYART